MDYFTSYKEYPPRSAHGNIFAYPFVPLQSQDWNTGLQTKQEIYNSGGHILKKVLNTYLHYVPDFADTLSNYKIGVTQLNNCSSPIYQTVYTIYGYNWMTSRSDKIQSTIVDYTPAGDSLVTNHWYSYDPAYYTLSKEVTTNSKNDSLASYHYYPFNYTISGSVLSAMRDSNMISTPVSNEAWRYINGNWVMTGADAMNYSRINNLYLPDTYYTLKTTTPLSRATIGVFNPSVLIRNQSVYELNSSIDVYSSNGNPLQLTQREVATTVYLWGYNNQHLVADIKNATYQAVLAVLGQSVINQLNNNPGTDAQVRTLLAPLRTALPNAQVMVYTYDLLAGVTSVTDAKGMTNYYEYDGLLRLINIKDKDGNIVKHTDYHYQNQ